jgi:hypothetical protein
MTEFQEIYAPARPGPAPPSLPPSSIPNGRIVASQGISHEGWRGCVFAGIYAEDSGEYGLHGDPQESSEMLS